ncbi:hypothetical protein BH20GEM2_BH20GEM2_03770 [soil metagenome]
MVLLTILSIVLILLLVAVLVVGLVKISGVLNELGGASMAYMGAAMGDTLPLLGKARWGVRAIERQTAVIEPQVTQLNAGLAAIDAGLGEVEAGMGGILAAVGRQGRGR